MTDIAQSAARAAAQIEAAAGAVDAAEFAALADAIAGAGRIVCHGVGREGLMMRALAMRLFHLGCDVHVLGDMTVPPVGHGDLLIVSAGPGDLSSVRALAETAREAGAAVACVTAQPAGAIPRAADLVLTIPAQTMADDRGAAVATLPMGSVFEGAQFLLFEILVLELKDRLGMTADAMRANHTNLE